MTFAGKLGVSELIQKIINQNDGMTGIYFTKKHPIMTDNDGVSRTGKDRTIITAKLSDTIKFELEKVPPKLDKVNGKAGEYRIVSLKEGNKEIYRFPSKEIKSKVL